MENQNVTSQNTGAAGNVLLNRGFLALEDGDFAAAEGFFEQALNANEKNADAYLGKLMAQLGVRDKSALKDCTFPFDGNLNYKNAMRFGNEALQNELRGYIAQINARTAAAQKEEAYRKAQEAFANAKTPAAFTDAAGLFAGMPGYRDADEKAAEAARKADALLNVAQKRAKVRKKRLIAAIISVAAVAVLIAGCFILNAAVIQPSRRYQEAVGVMEEGRYAAAGMLFSRMGNFKDAQEKAQTCWAKCGVRASIAAGFFHTVGLKTDGTVVAAGSNESGQCDVAEWKDIVAVAAGFFHTVGLKADGTVVATGSNDSGQCDVAEWKDIVAVAAGIYCTVGLKKDGTVVATGAAGDVSDWEDIVAVAAGVSHIFGLKADGTVAATDGFGSVSDWEDIVAVSAGWGPVVGLKSDGTPVAAKEDFYDVLRKNDADSNPLSSLMSSLIGYNTDEAINVAGWTDITAVAAYGLGIVGLKKDGTVVLTNMMDALFPVDVTAWTDVVAVTGGFFHAVALKKDGTVLCLASSLLDVGDVSGWKDIGCGYAAE